MGYSSLREVLLDQAQKIGAKARGGKMTADEKSKADSYLRQVEEIDREARWVKGDVAALPTGGVADRRQRIEEGKQMDEMVARALGGAIGPGGAMGFDLASAVISAGFSLKACPGVAVPSAAALGSKAVTDSIGADTWTVIPPADITGLGRDQRFLWRALPQRNADGNSAVADFVQTAHGVTGEIERSIDATSDKAEVTMTLDATVTQLVQWATVIADIPNQMLEDIGQLRTFLNGEMTWRIGLATDAHVVTKILAATPSSTTTGDDVIETARFAVADMRDNGANPSLWVLDPQDAAALDLAVQPGTSADYIFPLRDTGSSSPIWNLRVIESPAMAGHNPMVVDPQMLGTLYLGTTRLDADPFTGFKKNLTNLRAEVTGLFHVRNKQGVRFLETLS